MKLPPLVPSGPRVRELAGTLPEAGHLRGGGAPRYSGFPVHIFGVLVGSEPVPARVPHASVAGPFGERDLADQAGFHPVRAAGIRGRHRGAERAVVALQRAKLPHQLTEHRLGEPGADVPGILQAAVVVVDTHEQGSDRVRAAALAVLPAADD